MSGEESHTKMPTSQQKVLTKQDKPVAANIVSDVVGSDPMKRSRILEPPSLLPLIGPFYWFLNSYHTSTTDITGPIYLYLCPKSYFFGLIFCFFVCVQVKQFYTAPTLIRSLMRSGDHWVTGSDLSSLQLLGSVGEPINPEAWLWYHQVCTNPEYYYFQYPSPS